MPKSRGRRVRRTSGTDVHREPTGPAPDLGLMLRVDDAERHADAEAALRLILASPGGPRAEFWRPWRISRLTQLMTLGPMLPAWVTSRWILEQALQDLSPATRSTTAGAMDAAVALRGGPAALPGTDPTDARVKVLDGDWVYRQTYLFDLGGLETFLRDRASAELIASADRIDEWARATMGGFQLVGHGPTVTTWADLASGEVVDVPALGSGVLMLPGEHAIGRLVPIEGGRMFETAPLAVPEYVARQVADDPFCWRDALEEDREAGGQVKTGGHRFGFIADVPDVVLLLTVLPDLDWKADPSDAEIVAALMSTANDALAEHAGLRRGPADEVSLWPCLAAAVVDPLIVSAVVNAPGTADAAVLERLGGLLAEPAGAVCRSMAVGARAAA